MKIQFIGVGEAFDERYPNTSILVSLNDSDESRHVLLDCGLTAAAAYYAQSSVGAELDAIWISHFHGDHFLGLPMLLLRFREDGRTKPLTFVGQVGVEETLWAALDLAYPTFRQRIEYPVHVQEVTAGQEIHLLGANWSFAANEHSASAPCLSLRIDSEGRSVFYSGDGRPTQATSELARGVTLLIHEAYGMEADTLGHGGVLGCLDMARNVRANALALVHVNRKIRQNHAKEIRHLLTAAFGSRGILPEPGDVLAL